jgi:twinkle protein
MTWSSTHIPCPCGESSDAYSVDVNGNGHCFSCNKHFPNTSREIILETTKNLSKQFIDYRDIPREIRQLYGSYILTNEKNDLVEAVYPYKSFSKHRILPKQGFYATGDNPKAHELFGMGLFNAGSSPIVVLTEGEEDAMAAYYALGKKFPVHSVKSSSSAYKDCSANYDYLNSFEKIYLSFDNDEPGKEAVRRVAVYNLTAWIEKHPGGERGILSLCGVDGTEKYTGKHGGQAGPEKALAGFEMGKLK